MRQEDWSPFGKMSRCCGKHSSWNSGEMLSVRIDNTRLDGQTTWTGMQWLPIINLKHQTCLSSNSSSLLLQPGCLVAMTQLYCQMSQRKHTKGQRQDSCHLSHPGCFSICSFCCLTELSPAFCIRVNIATDFVFKHTQIPCYVKPTKARKIKPGMLSGSGSPNWCNLAHCLLE